MTYLVIEWSGSAVTLSRFLARRGELVFQGADRRQAAAGELTATLQEMAPPTGDDCRCILALPLAHLFMRELELPIRDRQKLRELLPLELRGETALDADELVFAGLPLAGSTVLAVWGRKRELAALIRSAAEAGVEPEVVTAAPLHWGEILPQSAGTVAITDGAAMAVYRDGEPLFFRAVAGGDEVTQTLALLEAGKGITVQRTCGIGTSESVVASTVEPLPVPPGLAAAFGGDESAARRHAGAWALAQAVAQGEAVDLRSGELAWTKGRELLQRRLRIPLALAGLLVVLLAADAAVRYTLVKRDLASLDTAIGAIYREVFPARKKSPDEPAEMRAELRKLGAAGGKSEALATLRKLAEAKGDDIAGLFEVELDGSQVRIKGDARSAQVVNDYASRLGGSLASVDVGQITSKPDGSVTFAIRGSLKEAAK
ncbi:MAG: type II secretion system protein GspL [Desulfuromonadales bacterium]|nr:MAG: type II secretion system protein GspL [Desulfuromonadales bacterium]